MSAGAAHAGLERVAQAVEQALGEPLRVQAGLTLLGRSDGAGVPVPLPSSAAVLELGDARVWVPAPLEPCDPASGRAPIFLQAGRHQVLPTIRLFRHAPGRVRDLPAPEYLAHQDWLHAALTSWPFPLIRPGSHEPVPDKAHSPSTRAGHATLTALDVLAEKLCEPGVRLAFLARIIRYAILGARQTEYVRLGRARLLLVLPGRPRWLRPAPQSGLGLEVARALVLTARQHQPPSHHGRDGIPRIVRPLAKYRIVPTNARDWGIDPVHTPESEEIRIAARLGAGVAIEAGKLIVPADASVPLSVSSARLPFAGFNDPRRLLMAASTQAQAVALHQSEPPLVRNDTRGSEPPGVNLRVGYLAWQGLNHEDAWVLSESAAKRLRAVQTRCQVIAVRAVELEPELLVKEGDTVRRGKLLVRRRVAPLLLAPALEHLVHVESLDEIVPLEPEREDRAQCEGTIERIETWNLHTGEGVPEGWQLGPELRGAYRSVVRVRIRRELPLAVGDKLANRHGHKGIVGAILPDAEMPRWQGQPLEALIDPISVVNRSNWGQLYEALAGAVARHEKRDWIAPTAEVLEQARSLLGLTAGGQAEIQPPLEDKWLGDSAPVLAMAGVQFVMRLPHHAASTISASPAPRGRRVRSRAQRFGEMEQWACLAHGLKRRVAQPPRLAPAALTWQRLLAQAGFEIRLASRSLEVRRLALEGEPPEPFTQPLNLAEMTLPELFDALEKVTADQPAALVFDPPVPSVLLPRCHEQPTIDVRWVPLLPPEDRPPLAGPDGGLLDHELTTRLRAVIRAARERTRKDDANIPLRNAVAALLRSAYTLAVGWNAEGPASGKWSVLRREVFGRQMLRSGRATVSPAGPWEHGLDTIGLPPVIARAVLGLPVAPLVELRKAAEDARVWIKRDPLLHRWGLLPVRCRVVSGSTIRLPASLLGPLGADFDGDTVAVFALPDFDGDLEACRPSTLAVHDVLGTPMFLPGKQYVYGLHRLLKEPSLKEDFLRALQQAGAPVWPDDAAQKPAKQALEEWAQAAGRAAGRDGSWWALLERHALQGLALDPGMGLRLASWNQLLKLDAITQGAAKGDLYKPENAVAVKRILAGRSLEIYHPRRPEEGQPARMPVEPPGGAREKGAAVADDPIATVMVAAKESVGYFGGLFRRLLYAVAQAGPDFIRRGQALTEQLTQQVLSIKAGKRPLSFRAFQPLLRALLEGTPSKLPESLAHLQELWSDLQARLSVGGAASQGWRAWLRHPHELARRVEEARGECLKLPLDDPRVRLFLDTGDAS
jgi:hypothetical protein